MSPRFTFHPTPLAGLTLVERKPLADQRGYLERLFCTDEFAANGIQFSILQTNRTMTRRKGTVRGLHFQFPPHVEMKLVSCLAGRVFDVAVDLKQDSPTFLQWHGEELSAGNNKSLLIPAGFAHGLQTLEDDCELLYFHSAAYAAQAEGGIHPQEPRVGIAWPLPVAELSMRDSSHPALSSDFKGLSL
ncbi:MAG TPA: dTDP-4-dehydrorhamnose 3,5-epimerase family protein [Pseudolabrys sp.]|nr:dTDP-4-dehydrorhamnose 3,5-epimerase family protein [Pseudolabrys sp.]